MKVQSVIMPNDVCNTEELYFRVTGGIESIGDYIKMESGTKLNTFTYMNLFDVFTWKKYTGINKWVLKLSINGTGIIKLFSLKDREKQGQQLYCRHFDSKERIEVVIPFICNGGEEKIFFEVSALREVKVWDAGYEAELEDDYVCRDVHLGVIICTYKRNEAIKVVIEQLTKSAFFEPLSKMYGKLSIKVVDNASELSEVRQKYFKVFHNPNTGGSGGFTRGIMETRDDEYENGITHVVFMDDDVELLIESFYRLYAFLSLVVRGYEKEVVAGRMFRMDKRWVQYTAAEIWNAGDIQHIGWNTDMTNKELLYSINDNTGAEYSGWWFACFPMEFVRENIPLPFFLHCDDVEYGLRHGGTPIIINGIQVWHETYEYRQSPVIAYYDTRNSLIVNDMYGLLPEKEKVLEEWKRKISEFHKNEMFIYERMVINGMNDFIKGKVGEQNITKRYRYLCDRRWFCKWGNTILWRLVEIKLKGFWGR